MKQYLAMIGALFFLFGCTSTEKDEIRAFIPGSYVRFSDHEMRKEYDTLLIEVISEAGSNYRLTKSSSFQRKRDGQVFPAERKREIWTAIYDESSRVLHETRKGKVISFVPERGLLLIGVTEYKKIK